MTHLSEMTVTGSSKATPQDEELRQLVRGDYVHRTLYTDPSIFDKEMVRVFGGTWTYVAHESQIPKRDDFVTTNLGVRPIIVARQLGENPDAPQPMHSSRLHCVSGAERQREAVSMSLSRVDLRQRRPA